MVKLSPCPIIFLLSHFLIPAIASPVRPLAPLGNDGSVVLNKRTTLAPGFTWGLDPMRGVNIGGWLVLEVSSPPSYNRVRLCMLVSSILMINSSFEAI